MTAYWAISKFHSIGAISSFWTGLGSFILFIFLVKSDTFKRSIYGLSHEHVGKIKVPTPPNHECVMFVSINDNSRVCHSFLTSMEVNYFQGEESGEKSF